MDQPQLRRFQFGLRALLLAFVPVAIIALPLGWYLRRPVPRPVAVSGTVTLHGQPLDGAQVAFVPIDPNGRAAVGTSDTSGRFRLQTLAGGSTIVPGALPGDYKVTLMKIVMVRAPMRGADTEVVTAPAESAIPGRYGNVTTSGLTAEVTVGDPNNFDFELVSE